MNNNLIPSKFYESYDNPYVKALVQLIPFGGVAGELIEEKIRLMKSERLKVFFDKLEAGEIELTEDMIENDEFLHSYFSTVRYVLNTRRKDKIALFALLFRSLASTKNSINFDEYEDFSKILDEISIQEYYILLKLKEFEIQYPKVKDENELVRAGKYWEDFKNSITQALNFPENEFSSCMVRLERTGLYSKLTASYHGDTGVIGYTTPLFDRFNSALSEEN